MKTIKKIMENSATAVATRTATEGDPTHLFGLNQVNPSVSDMEGQR